MTDFNSIPQLEIYGGDIDHIPESLQQILWGEAGDNRGSGPSGGDDWPEGVSAAFEGSRSKLSAEHALWVLHNRAPYQ